jgi:phosphoribosylformylglycinamidine cyclo-ligase
MMSHDETTKQATATSTRESGLDLDLGDRCSRRAFDHARGTFANRTRGPGAPVLDGQGTFANLIDVGGARVALTSDGIGTKVELAERTGVFDTLGYDLVAMVADDLVAIGAEPVSLTNVLDVDRLDEPRVDALMRGLAAAATEARMTVTGGEIAELGRRVGGFGEGMHVNWCATAVGVMDAGRAVIDGRDLRAGDAIVGLASRGFRSNGYSLVRRVMEASFGEGWHARPFDDATSWGEALLTPSRVFAPLVIDMLRAGVVIRGVAHVTGGGVPDKLGRVLRITGLGAEIDAPLPPHPAMIGLQRLGGVEERSAYRLWNMGQGMLLVTPPDAVDQALALAEAAGVPAGVVGRVSAAPGVRIASRGASPQDLAYGGDHD